MIKDGCDLVKQSLLWLFNCMLAGRFPERLSVGLITAVYKSDDKSDMAMSILRGTVDAVTGELFAMILEQKIASWTEDQAVKAKGQAGFKNSAQLTTQSF